MFDSQSDIAAVVYRPCDAPDRLLQAFAEDLRDDGYRHAGLIQLDHRRPWDDAGVRLVTLPGNDIVALTHVAATPHAACRPDPQLFSAVHQTVCTAIAHGVDLVMINRFGRMEAEGLGFADAIRTALTADVPVLITVPEHRFETWTRFSHGMGVKLACERAPLDAWWRGVCGAPPLARQRATTFCEVAK